MNRRQSKFDRVSAVADVRRHRCCSVMLLALLLAIVGCGGKYDASVSGTVTLDGNPLPRGTVMFHPSGPGPSAYGLIEPDGSFAMKIGQEWGLPSGDYVVTVVANEPTKPPSRPGAPGLPGDPITPNVYRRKQTSNLKETVSKGKNSIDLKLKTE